MIDSTASGIFQITVDRIEGEFAVCPDAPVEDIKLSEIPFNVKEKDVILVKYDESGELVFVGLKLERPKRKIPRRFIRFV